MHIESKRKAQIEQECAPYTLVRKNGYINPRDSVFGWWIVDPKGNATLLGKTLKNAHIKWDAHKVEFLKRVQHEDK